ncbi:hypothetical protein GCM10010297_46310 [Streptomyces malachitofuscus]|nr:hypothetical protein GCM10010297_46310 [Streptomyces malachitofuscus]
MVGVSSGSDPQGRLQINSIEARMAETAMCVVWCVGGVVRPGHRFTRVTAEPPSQERYFSIDEVIRYGRRAAFVDAPHNAKVNFSGPEVSSLARGSILVSVVSDPEPLSLGAHQ